jgi:hypothetical protein
VKSLIRVTDRLLFQASGPDASEVMPEFLHDLIGFLSFKAGRAQGPVPMKITLTRPSGLTDTQPVWQGTVHFEGGTRGHNLLLRLRIRFMDAGPYWFNVYVQDKLITRMSYEVIYTFTRTAGPPQQ